MGFVMQWLWCLLAYLLGSVVAWLITVVAIKRTNEEQSFADLPGSSQLEVDR